MPARRGSQTGSRKSCLNFAGWKGSKEMVSTMMATIVLLLAASPRVGPLLFARRR